MCPYPHITSSLVFEPRPPSSPHFACLHSLKDIDTAQHFHGPEFMWVLYFFLNEVHFTAIFCNKI